MDNQIASARGESIAAGPRPAKHLMIPREHGTYAELAFPILTVLLAGRPTVAAWLLTAAAVLVFFAHEPLIVMLGLRGSRLKREQSRRATKWLVGYVLMALGFGVAGLAQAPGIVTATAILPLLLATISLLLTLERLGKTAIGEMTAAVALASAALPIGLASGLNARASIAVVLIWALCSVLATAAVRLSIADHRAKSDAELKRNRTNRAVIISICIAVFAVSAFAPQEGNLNVWLVSAALPVAIAAFIITLAKPSTRHLRQVGWTLVAANALTLVATVAAIRFIRAFDAFETNVPFTFF